MADNPEWGAALPASAKSRPWAIGVGTAIALAVLTMIVGFLVMAIAIRTIDDPGAVEINVWFGFILWSVLVLATVFVTLLVAVRVARSGSPRFWLGVATAAYVLNPLSWGGSAVGVRNVLGLGELGEAPGAGLMILGWILDLGVWLAAAYLAIVLSRRHTEQSASMRGLA